MRKDWIKEHFAHLDYYMIALVVFLSVAGLFFIYSATLSSESLRNVAVQSFALFLGLVFMFAVSFVDYRSYKPYANYIYIGSVAVLIFVLIFGSGREETGANSWIRFLGIGIQPSELVKIAFAVVFSFKLSDAKEAGKLNDIKEVLKLTAFYAGITGLVILQNDTGTALVFTFMFVVMFFLAGLSYKYILTALGAFILLLPLAWLVMAPYQRNRILVFFNPEMDPTGAGYQVLQSKIAVGSGELLGRGYLNGPQNQLSLLPEKETDFIFGTIGEEFGFLGCAVVVILLFLLVLRCFTVSKKAKDEAGRFICAGIGAMFLFHIIENVCMCLGLLPVTGIPLPFLSYGGSSLVTNFIATGLIQNIYKVSKELSFNKYD